MVSTDGQISLSPTLISDQSVGGQPYTKYLVFCWYMASTAAIMHMYIIYCVYNQGVQWINVQGDGWLCHHMKMEMVSKQSQYFLGFLDVDMKIISGTGE